MPVQAKVLLVDDDPVSLRMLQKALATTGLYEIRTATDGVEGLEKALKFQPDLIISDKVMPHMDGLEFCRRIKSESSLSTTLFVILSGINEPEARIEGLEQGADDYLVKPLPFDELKARVRSFLRRKPSEEGEAASRPESVSSSFAEQVTELLMQVGDLRCAGAASRALQIAAAAEWIAENMDMPLRERPHLRLAAHLQEIGKIGVGEGLAGLNPIEVSPADWPSFRAYAAASQAILERVDAFHQAATLVRHQFENWDGSGFPDHLHYGRIPLGSRILRVLVDFFHDLEQVSRPETRDRLLDRLKDRVLTIYDPAAYDSLIQYVRQSLDTSLVQKRRFVPVEDLQPGMKLAADLTTSSGAVLLRRDEVLSRQVVERIRRHHAMDPIVFSIEVYPGADSGC